MKLSEFTMLCLFQGYGKVIQLYIYLFFFRFFSYLVITEYWVELPVLYSRSLLSICFTCSSVYIGFPDGASGKGLPVNAGDVRATGSIPESGRFPGGGNGNPLQYSCLGSHRVGHDWSNLAQHGVFMLIPNS